MNVVLVRPAHVNALITTHCFELKLPKAIHPLVYYNRFNHRRLRPFRCVCSESLTAAVGPRVSLRLLPDRVDMRALAGPDSITVQYTRPVRRTTPSAK